MAVWEKVEAFLQEEARYERMLAPFGAALLDAAGLARGERIIDAGCGAGSTAIAIAELGARVLAVDVDRNVVGRAAQRAHEAQAPGIEFVIADAGEFAFAPAVYDAVLSRFAVMLFDPPAAALTNLRRALRRRGRLVATVWQNASRNVWHALPAQVVSDFAGTSCDLHEVGGPFAFADPARVHSYVREAGFRDVHVDGIERPVWVGEDADDVVTFFDQDAGANLRNGFGEVGTQSIFEELRRRVVDYATPAGVFVPAAAWVVTARA